MSYSSLTNKYIPASADNYMRGRGGYKVCKITPHHMACQWSAERCAQSFQVSGRMASANYCIGSDGTIVANVDEENRAWTSSNYYNDCQAITIEIANDNTNTWTISSKAWNALVNLCVDVCKRYGFKLNYTGNANGSLTEHRMFTATSCPGPYLHSKMPQLAQEVNARLDGQTVAPTQPSTPNAPSEEKYSTGTPICTNTLSVNCYGTGKVYKGDWSGTIGRVIKGAKYPYRVDRNGVAIGWTNNVGIDSDPHVPGGTTTQSTPTVLNSVPSDFIRESATFYPNCTIKIRKAPSLKGVDTGSYYTNGMHVNYDGYVKREGYCWISWISASTGERRWMACGELNQNGYNTSPYGVFK
jgi:hypothetical protein